MSIVEVLAAVGVLGGAVLIVLGSIGLMRFPDVFTRMHAATKSATVGVIGVTAAAALEAGTLGGVLILGLVVVLLFLSGPLGMSLLARAAFHDPQTPRHRTTRELAVDLPIPESTPVQRTGGTSVWLAAWLLIIWIAVFGSLAPHVIAGGVVISGLIAYALRGLSPRWPQALLHPVAATRFVVHFLVQLLKATWDVAWTLRLHPDQLRPAVCEVPLRVQTRNEVTLLMNAISFTPGTVALELHENSLYVHVLTMTDSDPVIEDITRLEDHIMAAFSWDPSRKS